MAPALLLDKSGVQSLPRKLLPTLSRYYPLVVPPVLVMEILGDLFKPRQGGVEWMRILSEKIGWTEFFVNIDHRELRVASLCGKPVVMDGRPVVRAEGFDTTSGRSALVAETAQDSQLL